MPKDQLCQCGHDHNSHKNSFSINYSAGKCTRCNCQYFLNGDPDPSRDYYHELGSDIIDEVLAWLRHRYPAPLSDAHEFELKRRLIDHLQKVVPNPTPTTVHLTDKKAPFEYKKLSPILPGEPTFTIRAKDNFSIAVLRLLKPVYGIGDSVIDWFEEWRAANRDKCKDPD